jgi:hypothetical protein
MLDKLSLLSELIVDSLNQMSSSCSNSFIVPSEKHHFDEFADVKVGTSVTHCFVSSLLIILLQMAFLEDCEKTNLNLVYLLEREDASFIIR